MADNITIEQLIEWQKANKPYIDAYVKAVGTGATWHGEAFETWKKGQLEYLDELFKKQDEANKKNWDEWTEGRRKVINEQSEIQKNYTNLIMIAGYAGYFWIWERFHTQMTYGLELWSGLTIIISIGIFVFSEIWGMYILSTRNIKHFEVDGKRVHDTMPDAERYDHIENYYRKKLIGVWGYHFYPAVYFGLIAYILLINFVLMEILLK